METTVEKPVQGSRESRTMGLHDHELVHELGRHLDALCRYAQCIADAEGDAQVQQTWRDLELHEQAKIRSLKQEIASRIEKGEFLEDL
jgi:hypothetical protein